MVDYVEGVEGGMWLCLCIGGKEGGRIDMRVEVKGEGWDGWKEMYVGYGGLCFFGIWG